MPESARCVRGTSAGRLAAAVVFWGWCLVGSSAGTNEVGKKFLEENKGRDGVITLKSGLQYKVLKKGEGKYHPRKDSPCECHYAGTTPALTPDAIDKEESDWNEFDSSYKKGGPVIFAPQQAFKGWTEALQLMVEGDKWELYVPSELGYGDKGSGSGEKIKGGDVLIFRVELSSINGPKVRVVKCDLKTRENCEPEEVEVLDAFGKKSMEDLASEIEEIEALNKKTDQVLKAGEREKAKAKLKVLKQIQKARKKAGGAEL